MGCHAAWSLWLCLGVYLVLYDTLYGLLEGVSQLKLARHKPEEVLEEPED